MLKKYRQHILRLEYVYGRRDLYHRRKFNDMLRSQRERISNHHSAPHLLSGGGGIETLSKIISAVGPLPIFTNIDA